MIESVFAKKVRILLLGDYMLDKYTFGEVERISPEAPVPILKVLENSVKAGGAGNVLLNLISLGADVDVVGRVGDDIDGRELRGILSSAGADVCNLFFQKDYKTTVKNRLIASSQQLMRVDQEEVSSLSYEFEEVIVQKLDRIIKDKDVVAISDYNKGFLTNRLLESVIEKAKEIGVPVIIDPKGVDFSKYFGATIIKPNLSEAYLAAGVSKNESVDKVANILMEKTGCRYLVITKSDKGISLFDGNKRKDFLVSSKEVKDVTGAGDSVLAMMARAIGGGCDIEEAIELANVAAGIAIEHVGCYSVLGDEVVKRCLETPFLKATI